MPYAVGVQTRRESRTLAQHSASLRGEPLHSERRGPPSYCLRDDASLGRIAGALCMGSEQELLRECSWHEAKSLPQSRRPLPIRAGERDVGIVLEHMVAKVP